MSVRKLYEVFEHQCATCGERFERRVPPGNDPKGDPTVTLTVMLGSLCIAQSLDVCRSCLRRPLYDLLRGQPGFANIESACNHEKGVCATARGGKCDEVPR